MKHVGRLYSEQMKPPGVLRGGGNTAKRAACDSWTLSVGNDTMLECAFNQVGGVSEEHFNLVGGIGAHDDVGRAHERVSHEGCVDPRLRYAGS